MESSKQFDTKFLGLLTAFGAFGSLIVVNRMAVGLLWSWALVPAVAGVVGCLVSLFDRGYDTGPDVRAAYETYAAGASEPSAFLIAELAASVRHNARVAKWKSIGFGTSASFLVVALVLVGISLAMSRMSA